MGWHFSVYGSNPPGVFAGGELGLRAFDLVHEQVYRRAFSHWFCPLGVPSWLFFISGALVYRLIALHFAMLILAPGATLARQDIGCVHRIACHGTVRFVGIFISVRWLLV